MVEILAPQESIESSSAYTWGGRREIVDTESFKDEGVEKFNTNVEKLCRDKELSSTPFPKPQGPTKKFYPIWSVENKDSHINFKKPLILELEREGDLYLFYHEDSRVLGTGNTKYEALQDFQDAFIEIYFSYKETPEEKLTDKAIQLLRYLDDLTKA